MGLFSYRPRFFSPKEREKQQQVEDDSKPQLQRTSEDGETTLAASHGDALEGLSNTQSALTDVDLFGPDYDLPRMRGFNLWHR